MVRTTARRSVSMASGPPLALASRRCCAASLAGRPAAARSTSCAQTSGRCARSSSWFRIPPFWDDLSVWEYLGFVAAAHRLSPDGRGVPALFGLARRGEACPGALSRGMRLKRALAHGPCAPAAAAAAGRARRPAGLPVGQAAWGVLTALAAEGRSLVVSCHQWPTEPVPDRCVVMETGRVRADAPVNCPGVTG